MDKIGIIGLGYVGLPLAVEFGKKFDVIGFDINKDRINELKSGYDRTHEVETERIEDVASIKVYSMSLDDLREAKYFIVTVPTPIDEFKKPDLRPLELASAICWFCNEER